MKTPPDYVVNAAEAVREAFQCSPVDCEVANVIEVIEKAIQEAILEREGTECQREAEVQAAVHQGVERLPTSSSELIYSFAVTKNFSTSFVGENIRKRFGYNPSDYFRHPDF